MHRCLRFIALIALSQANNDAYFYWIPSETTFLRGSKVTITCHRNDSRSTDALNIFATARDCENCQTPSNIIFLGQYQQLSSIAAAVEFVANQPWRYLQVACTFRDAWRSGSSVRIIRIADCPDHLPEITMADHYIAGQASSFTCTDSTDQANAGYIFVNLTMQLTIGRGSGIYSVNKTTPENSQLVKMFRFNVRPAPSWNAQPVRCRSQLGSCPLREISRNLTIYYLQASVPIPVNLAALPGEQKELNCALYVTSNPPASFTWRDHRTGSFTYGSRLSVWPTRSGLSETAIATCVATNRASTLDVAVMITWPASSATGVASPAARTASQRNLQGGWPQAVTHMAVTDALQQTNLPRCDGWCLAAIYASGPLFATIVVGSLIAYCTKGKCWGTKRLRQARPSRLLDPVVNDGDWAVVVREETLVYSNANSLTSTDISEGMPRHDSSHMQCDSTPSISQQAPLDHRSYSDSNLYAKNRSGRSKSRLAASPSNKGRSTSDDDNQHQSLHQGASTVGASAAGAEGLANGSANSKRRICRGGSLSSIPEGVTFNRNVAKEDCPRKDLPPSALKISRLDSTASPACAQQPQIAMAASTAGDVTSTGRNQGASSAVALTESKRTVSFNLL